MEAENNEDESYYLSNSPVRRGAGSNNVVLANNARNQGNHVGQKVSALSYNPQSFGQQITQNGGVIMDTLGIVQAGN